MMQGLSNEEIEACQLAFAKFDKDNSGAIDMWELRSTLQCESSMETAVSHRVRMCAAAAMGQDPTDEELFDMIAEVDADGSGEIGAVAANNHADIALPN
eukprot:6212389-Pleurochrysis_carterae.AAC.2